MIHPPPRSRPGGGAGGGGTGWAGLVGRDGCGEGQHRSGGGSYNGGVPGVCLYARGLGAGGAAVVGDRGKTNLDQLATGLVEVRSPYGVPRKVFGAGHVPGAFGNIVGLKPPIGSVSATGMAPACRSVDTISVFARTVDRALAVQRVMAGG